jgi:RNA polymerase sigma-70 factor (ECF subfamily)
MSPSDHDEFLNATLPALDLVYNLARRLHSDPGQVEDLVQETYARAFEAWVAGRKPRRVQPWIATICLNTGRNMLRKASARREEPMESPPEVADRSDVETEAMRHARRDLVQWALWQLPEEQRIAVALTDLGGLSSPEVARITGAPRGTVVSRVHRARKKLAQLIESKVSRLEA